MGSHDSSYLWKGGKIITRESQHRGTSGILVKHCDLMWILVTWVYSLGENLLYGTLKTFHEFIKNMRIHVYAHCPSNVSNIKSQ